MTATATRTPVPPKRVSIGDHPIRARLLHQLGWGIGLGLAAVAFVAAVYYAITQVDYGTWAGVHWWLKPHWDGLFSQPWWDTVRHDIRNIGEGVAAKLITGSFVTGSVAKAVRTRPLSGKVVAPAAVFLLAAGLGAIIAGIWVLDFGGPAAWHVLFGSRHLVIHWTPPGWLAQVLTGFNWQQFVIGFAVGFPVHKIWQRVGGRAITLDITERLVSRWRNTGVMPAAVRWPLLPPAIREEAAWRYDEGLAVHQRGAVAGWLPAAAILAFLALAGWGEYILHVVAKG